SRRGRAARARRQPRALGLPPLPRLDGEGAQAESGRHVRDRRAVDELQARARAHGAVLVLRAGEGGPRARGARARAARGRGEAARSAPHLAPADRRRPEARPRVALAAGGLRDRGRAHAPVRERAQDRADPVGGAAGDPRHAGVRARVAAVRGLPGAGAIRCRDGRRALRHADRHPALEGRAGGAARGPLHAGTADPRAARGLPGSSPPAHACEPRRQPAAAHHAQRRPRRGLGALLRGADVGAGLLHGRSVDAAVPAPRPAVPRLPRRARRGAPFGTHDAATGGRLSCRAGDAGSHARRERGESLLHHPHATHELPGRETPDPRAALGSPAQAGRTLPTARLPCGPPRQRDDPAGAGARGAVVPAGGIVRARAAVLLTLLTLLVPPAQAVEPADKYAVMPKSTGLEWSAVSFKSTRDAADLNGWWFEGKPDAPVLVLFDRAKGNMGDLIPVVAEFAGRGFTVMTFDYRDFGPAGPGPVDS